MAKILTWYTLSLKMMAKKRSTWIQLLAMVLLVLLLTTMYIPDGQNLSAGVYTAGGQAGERIMERLKQQTMFDFIEYNSAEKLEQDVEKGIVECGFLLSDDFDERLEDGDVKGTIRYICSPSTSKGLIMRVTFYTSYFRIYSEQLLKDNEESFFGNQDEERTQKWMELHRAMYESDEVYQVEYREVEGVYEEDIVEQVTYPVQGITGFMILLILFLYYGKRFEADKDGVARALMPRERFWYSGCGMLAAATMPAIVGLTLVLTSVNSRGFIQEVCAMMLFLVYAIIWVQVLGRFSNSKESHISLILIILVVNLLICPILIDLSAYVSALKYVRYLSPVGLYVSIFV